jgi:hypothetical protein
MAAWSALALFRVRVLAGSGSNDDDYVFTARRFVALRAAP